MTVANTNGAGAVVNGESGGGAGLPTAAGADEVPVSTGAGTTYTATPLAAAVGDTLADLYGALDAGDFYVSDGAGVVPASSVASTVRAAVQVASRATIDADGDSPAWTDAAAEAATAAFTGGVATFTAPSGVNVAATSRARSSVTLAAMGVTDPWRVRLEARLTSYNASGARRAALSIGSVAGGIIGANYTTGDMAVQAFVLDAGTIAIYDYVSTAFTLRATSSTTLTLDGQDWLALELRGESIRVFRGRGSSRPTTWDLVASATWAGGVGGTWAKSPAYAALAAYRADTTASVFTATWSSVRLTDLQ